MENNKQITLHDVAKASGVSHQTVSRVINNHASVSIKTREKVESAIQKLGYKPNVAARKLVTGKSNTVGIISFGVGQYGPSQMQTSIEHALRAKEFGVVVATLSELSLNEIQDAVQYLRNQAVDGIVMITPLNIELSDIQAICLGTPVVLVDVFKKDSPSVAIDQKKGAQLATQHLIDLGHKDIIEITGPLLWHDATLRHEGFLSTLKRVGLEPQRSLESDWSAKGGYETMKTILDTDSVFTALFAANDQMALGAIHALHEAGMSVPEDVSVIGFDDIPEASYFYPPLSTIRQNFTELANSSVKTLLALIENTKVPKNRLLKPSLVLRNSTAEFTAKRSRKS